MKEKIAKYSLTADEVTELASLIKIRLTDDQRERFTSDYNELLDDAAKLNALDISEVEPMVNPLRGSTALREDISLPGLTQKEALKAATETEAGFFRVPKTIDA